MTATNVARGSFSIDSKGKGLTTQLSTISYRAFPIPVLAIYLSSYKDKINAERKN
jgi:hypothetical protein